MPPQPFRFSKDAKMFHILTWHVHRSLPSWDRIRPHHTSVLQVYLPKSLPNICSHRQVISTKAVSSERFGITYVCTPIHIYQDAYLLSVSKWKIHRAHTPSLRREGADKSLARPTSRCRRTESIVSLERGACSCAELQVFSCYRSWKEASGDARDFNNIETRAVIKFFFTPVWWIH